MTIRPMYPTENPQVKSFVLSILQEFGFSYRNDLDYDLDNLLDVYKKRGGDFYIMEEDGELIGTIGYKDRGNKTAELKRLYLEKKHRGKGYGYQLLDFVMKKIKDQGFHKVILDTHEQFTQAIFLYKKYGFSITNYDKQKGCPIDMEKNIV